MKKGLVITGVLLAVLVGGGYTANQYVSDKIGDEVMKLTQDPSVQKAIDKAIADGLGSQKIGEMNIPVTGQAGGTAQGSANGNAAAGGANGTAGTQAATGGGSAASTILKFGSREEAIAYAKSKFSTAEIAEFTTKYLNKDQLTRAEKDAIKQSILSRFTPQEMQALQEAAKL